jgi:hypothetical protein
MGEEVPNTDQSAQRALKEQKLWFKSFIIEIQGEERRYKGGRERERQRERESPFYEFGCSCISGIDVKN